MRNMKCPYLCGSRNIEENSRMGVCLKSGVRVGWKSRMGMYLRLRDGLVEGESKVNRLGRGRRLCSEGNRVKRGIS